jgi:LmbE family N-acetylglucosaminyl deacetylase
MSKRHVRSQCIPVSLLSVGVLLLLVAAAAYGNKESSGASAGPAGAALSKPPAAPEPSDSKMRIICFGAHPDDCEFSAGGTAAMWASRGHHVKFVSCTNGDIGHWGMAGGALAQRRIAEVQRCARIFGVETEVLDIHDGELLPTLENRKTIVRLIRQWRADIVMCHRSNDYHPDHRNVGLLVQDAGYMVGVPFFCPDTLYLRRNPAFFYYEDGFQKPYPFVADVVVGIDEVIAKKLDAVIALESQTLEGGCDGSEKSCPTDPQARKAYEQQVRQRFDGYFAGSANQFRKQLAQWYGQEQAGKIRYAEAFEICEYGRQPSKKEIRELFPFFPAQ